MNFKTGSCSLVITWFKMWAAKTAGANWDGSMSLPLKTANFISKAMWPWKVLSFEKVRALRRSMNYLITLEEEEINPSFPRSPSLETKLYYTHCHLSIRVRFMNCGKRLWESMMESIFLFLNFQFSIQQQCVERILCRCCSFFSPVFISWGRIVYLQLHGGLWEEKSLCY